MHALGDSRLAMTRKTTLRPPPLTLLDKYHGKEILTLYSTTVTVTGGEVHHGLVLKRQHRAPVYLSTAMLRPHLRLIPSGALPLTKRRVAS